MFHSNDALSILYPGNATGDVLVSFDGFLKWRWEDEQDEVEDDDNCIDTEHTKGVEKIQLRFHPSLSGVSNDVLGWLVDSLQLWLRREHSLLSPPGRHILARDAC